MRAHTIAPLILNLIIQGGLAVAVWKHYRSARFPISERYSTFGPRFWTGTVDSCVLWPVRFGCAALLAYELSEWVAAMVVLGQNFAWLIYTIVMHARYGQTYGKMVCKVRVVDHRTEGPISGAQALLRESIPLLLTAGLVSVAVYGIISGTMDAETAMGRGLEKTPMFWLLASVPGLWFVAEVVTMFSNAKNRALHDFIAGTVVIRTNIEEAEPARSSVTSEARV